jgi:hypothetical protein
MEMPWLGYVIGIVGVGRNIFVVTVQVNYLAYVERNTPKYSVFFILTRETYSVTALPICSHTLGFF